MSRDLSRDIASGASLASAVRRGAMWSGLGSVILRAGTFAMGVVIARLVAPEQVGVFVVALTVQMVVISASELGVATAIARAVGDSGQATANGGSALALIGPTATTLSIASSSVLAAAMALTAPFLAGALGAAEAAPVIQVMALTIVLAGIASVSNGLLMREFLQKRRFAGELSGFAVQAVAVASLAGFGAMGLSVSRVIGQAATTVVIVWLAPRRFRPGFDSRQARDLLRFGVPLVGASALGFATTNTDYVVVGRMGGPLALGPYSLAFNVSSWPLTLLTSMVNSVALPAFARAIGSPGRLTRQVCSVVGAVALVGFPVSALTMALALPLVLAVYGSAWAPAAPALVALTVVGALRVPLDVLGCLIVAAGLTRAYLAVQALQLAASIPALVIGVSWGGIVGAGLAQLAVTAAIVLPAYLVIVSRSLSVQLRPVIASVVPAAFAALLCGISAALAAGSVTGVWSQLLVGGSIGGAVYVLAMAPSIKRLIASTGVRVPAVVR